MKNLGNEAPLSNDWAFVSDPVERLLLEGSAETVFEAEEKYLDAAYPEALALLASPLSDDELAGLPLFQLYRSYGSPGREDSLR